MPLVADRGEIGAWEYFQLIYTGDEDGAIVFIAKANDKYVCAERYIMIELYFYL